MKEIRRRLFNFKTSSSSNSISVEKIDIYSSGSTKVQTIPKSPMTLGVDSKIPQITKKKSPCNCKNKKKVL